MLKTEPCPEGGRSRSSAKLLSQSLAPTHEFLTQRAPAMLFQMLMTNSAESLKLGQAIQPVVFGEAPLVLETVDSPLRHGLHPPWSFVWCSNRHRCSSCLTQGHFSPLIATLYADGLHLSQQLSSRSCIPPLLLHSASFSDHRSSSHEVIAVPKENSDPASRLANYFQKTKKFLCDLKTG